jgi:hypothetical protein
VCDGGARCGVVYCYICIGRVLGALPASPSLQHFGNHLDQSSKPHAAQHRASSSARQLYSRQRVVPIGQRWAGGHIRRPRCMACPGGSFSLQAQQLLDRRGRLVQLLLEADLRGGGAVSQLPPHSKWLPHVRMTGGLGAQPAAWWSVSAQRAATPHKRPRPCASAGAPSPAPSPPRPGPEWVPAMHESSAVRADCINAVCLQSAPPGPSPRCRSCRAGPSAGWPHS